MSEQPVVPGDKLHVVTRRLFEDDTRRHFAGEVLTVSGDLCELEGYAFVFNPTANEFRRRPELRRRILSVAHAGHVVNKLPRQVDLGSLEYRVVNRRLMVIDAGGFSLDVNEFGFAG